MSENYLISVAPIVSLPLKREPFFTYTAKQNIQTGSLVRIPLASRSVEGIVLESRPLQIRPSYPLKEISTIISEAFINKETIELARNISEYTFTPFGITLKHALPKRVIERKKIGVHAKKLKERKSLNETERRLFNRIIRGKKAVYCPSDPSEKKNIFLELAERSVKEQEQILFLFPDIILIHEWRHIFSEYFKEGIIAPLESKLSDGAFYSYWEKIRSGEAKIILGTRQSIFAPFQGISRVVIDFDGAPEYKQWDMAPRYRGDAAAKLLADIHHIPCLSVAPERNKEKGLKHISAPIQVKNNPIILSDLRLDRYKKNFSPFSELTMEYIGNTLKKGRSVLCIINRQGSSIFSVCERCKAVLRCPNCERALIGRSSGAYECLHCSYKTDAFPKCSSCGNLSFRSIGFGTEKVERELSRAIRHSKILRIDRSTLKNSEKMRNITENIQGNNVDIVIGTDAVLHGPELPKIGLIAILDADNTLRFPDFQAEERFLREVKIAIWKVRNSGGTVILQTFHSEQLPFQRVLHEKWDEFREKILEERSIFSYPPFGILIKISFSDEDSKNLQKNCSEAIKILSEGKQGSWKTSEVITPLLSKIRKKEIRSIIIRIKGKDIPEELSSKLILLSKKGWTIDRDPININ